MWTYHIQIFQPWWVIVPREKWRVVFYIILLAKDEGLEVEAKQMKEIYIPEQT